MSESSNTNNSAKSYHFCKHLNKAKDALDEFMFQIQKADHYISLEDGTLEYLNDLSYEVKSQLDELMSDYKKE